MNNEITNLQAIDTALRRSGGDLSTHEGLDAFVTECRTLPQVDMPLTHEFAPNVYLRTIFMPKGTFIIGARHKTEHFNIVTSGHARVLMDGELHDIKAPSRFVSRAGLRKILYILEDMTWICVFPLKGLEHCGQDVELLENELVEDAENILERRKAREVICGGG